MMQSPQPTLSFRAATEQDDVILAQHFYHLWLDNGATANDIVADWQTVVQQFIDHARQTLNYQAFVVEANDAIVGSVGCQLFAGLYPLVLADHHRKYGYIWGVYVEAAYRGQGLGKQLTVQAIAYLKSLNCTRIMLHASPLGTPVYKRLGFSTSNEMRFDLR
ncbi:GNAT family N-acetyltransferase [Pantanalinema rosaneae CENA516]|uniref:GNAT family N-acetyltransferase n=1 Tax=Pantanalinema rosaneae TaxID=1620701 RepID=UPI003D700307